METESKNEIGKVSLWVAIAGVAGAATIALLFILLEALTEAEMPFSLCLLLFIGLEVIALVTGIVGWSCPYGKAGFGASIVLLALTTFFIPVSRRVETSQGTGVEPIMVIERTQAATRAE
ncbi:MAG: hypothetical protein ACYTE3_09105 [Planctomycetota bacterium]